jgi:hypothetical protein
MMPKKFVHIYLLSNVITCSRNHEKPKKASVMSKTCNGINEIILHPFFLMNSSSFIRGVQSNYTSIQEKHTIREKNTNI